MIVHDLLLLNFHCKVLIILTLFNISQQKLTVYQLGSGGGGAKGGRHNSGGGDESDRGGGSWDGHGDDRDHERGRDDHDSRDGGVVCKWFQFGYCKSNPSVNYSMLCKRWGPATGTVLLVNFLVYMQN